MRDRESMRDVGTCLGGLLGMFLGGFLVFAVVAKMAFEKVARNDGGADPNSALLPFIWIIGGAGSGIVVGAVLFRLLTSAFLALFQSAARSSPRGLPGNDDSVARPS
jgi:hypothetical protein